MVVTFPIVVLIWYYSQCLCGVQSCPSCMEVVFPAAVSLSSFPYCYGFSTFFVLQSSSCTVALFVVGCIRSVPWIFKSYSSLYYHSVVCCIHGVVLIFCFAFFSCFYYTTEFSVSYCRGFPDVISTIFSICYSKFVITMCVLLTLEWYF